MKLIKLIILASLVIIVSVSASYSLETDIHKSLNEYIARTTLNGFSLDAFLRDVLVIDNGINESYNSNQIWLLIKDGGLYEDIPNWYTPYYRSVNHFHNPITDQGFTGVWGVSIFSGESSIQWSQKGLGLQSPGGFYSWHDAREYFYLSLRDTNKTIREINFASMFRGLGQLMHLVQDLSVPEHARDDGHYLPSYERWMKETNSANGLKNVHIFSDSGEMNISGTILTPNSMVFFDPNAIGGVNPLASVPVANLFDTNQYTGSNPNITLQADIGLAEYTNANFLSSDTMFNGTFQNPDIADTSEFNENSRTYLSKIGMSGGGSGESVSHIAATSWMYKYLPSNLKYLGVKLDKTVYKDYALKLVPRAVGYSAELLNYFFRGDIDLVDDTATGYGYVIVNNTEEDMDGTFEVYYDNLNDERILLWSSTFSLDTLSSGNNTSSNVSISSPSDAKLNGSFIVVFRGRLGNESDAVIGRVVEQHNLAIFIRQGGIIRRCLTTYKDLINDVPCTLEIANNVYNGPVISNNDSLDNRITQKAFSHYGKKIYLTHMGQQGTYLFVPRFHSFVFLHNDKTFFNASDQNIYLLELSGSQNIKVYNLSDGLVLTGTYPSVPSTDYSMLEFVSTDGESYVQDAQTTVIGNCITNNCTQYRKYYAYNIFTGAISELGDYYYSEETYTSPGSNTYNNYYESFLAMSQKSSTNGIEVEFQPTEYRNNFTKITDGSGASTGSYVIDHLILGDSSHTVANFSSTPQGATTCQWTGDRVRYYSLDLDSTINVYEGLLVPNNATVPYAKYRLDISDAGVFNQSCYNVPYSVIFTSMKTPYETFDSSTEGLSSGNETRFLAEDIVGRNFSISGFVIEHEEYATGSFYDELILYNHDGERIDHHVLNILGISDPTMLRGIFLMD